MEPEWKEPPAPRAGLSRRHDIDQMVEKLKSRPGQWALVSKNASPSVAAWKSRGCETKTVSAGLGYERGKCDSYARWPETAEKPAKKKPVSKSLGAPMAIKDEEPKAAPLAYEFDDLPWDTKK